MDNIKKYVYILTLIANGTKSENMSQKGSHNGSQRCVSRPGTYKKVVKISKISLPETANQNKKNSFTKRIASQGIK